MKKITLSLALMMVLVMHLISGISSKIDGRYRDMPDRCLIPMDLGYCKAKMKRYYFNTNRNKCSPFFFGGCAGNANNFETLEECNKLCGGTDLIDE